MIVRYLHFPISSLINNDSIAAAMKRIIMNNLQKLEFDRLLDYNVCKEKLRKIPNDVVCTEETHSRNVCLVCFSLKYSFYFSLHVKNIHLLFV